MAFVPGVYTDKEISDLSAEDRKLLKEHVMGLLLSSDDTREVIKQNPQLISQIVEKDASLTANLRQGSDPLLKRLRGK